MNDYLREQDRTETKENAHHDHGNDYLREQDRTETKENAHHDHGNDYVVSGSKYVSNSIDATQIPQLQQNKTVAFCSSHVDELENSAISVEYAQSCGVYSVQKFADLPKVMQETLSDFGELSDQHFPALVYPMREIDGSETCQVKFNVPLGTAKYVSPEGARAPLMPVVSWGASRKSLLIVEGVKQALAVAQLVDSAKDKLQTPGLPMRQREMWTQLSDCNVVRITGIESWLRDGEPNKHMRQVVQDMQQVYIVHDADAATNWNVYRGAERLREACISFGVPSDRVRFLQVPGAADKAGIDDFLARSKDVDSRAQNFTALVKNSKKKPAKKKPSRPEKVPDQPALGTDHLGRKQVEVSVDEHLMPSIKDLLESESPLYEFYNYGADKANARFSVVRANDLSGTLEKAQEVHLRKELTQHNAFVKQVKRGESLVWEPAKVDKDVLESWFTRVRENAPFVKATHTAPLMLCSGELLAESGYNQYLQLLMAPGKVKLTVPETVVWEDIAQARDKLLRLFAEFPFKSEADKANAVALLLTLIERPVVKNAPLFVVTGNQPGVGKTLLTKALLHLVFGAETPTVNPVEWTKVSDELTKRLASAAKAGQSAIFVDEVQYVQREVFAAAATSTVATRLLGTNDTVPLGHQTFILVGNNVETPGDVARRVVPIRLEVDDVDYAMRGSYGIPDLEEYVCQHRQELLSACFTLIRAGVQYGEQVKSRSFQFASFEQWQAFIERIMTVGSLPAFLTNVREFKVSADTMQEDTGLYLAALYQWQIVRQSHEFLAKDVTAEVRKKMQGSAVHLMVEPPISRPENDRSVGNYHRRIAGQQFVHDDGYQYSIAPTRKGSNGKYWTVTRKEYRPPQAIEPLPPVSALRFMSFDDLPVEEQLQRREETVQHFVDQMQRRGVHVSDRLDTEVEQAQERFECANMRASDKLGIPVVSYDKLVTWTQGNKQKLAVALRKAGVQLQFTKSKELAVTKKALYGYLEHVVEDSVLAEGLQELILATDEYNDLKSLRQLRDTSTHGVVRPKVTVGKETGRLEVSEPALLSLNETCRLFVEAPKGCVLASFDLQQVEARVIAHLSGDKDYQALFDPGRDCHQELARTLSDIAQADVDRKTAKRVMHGVNYGMGAKRLAQTAGISVNDAKVLLESMQKAYPRLFAWKQEVIQRAQDFGGVLTLPNGRCVHVDVNKAYTQAPAYMGQGYARDLFFDWLARLPQQWQEAVYLLVHDEVVFAIPEVSLNMWRSEGVASVHRALQSATSHLTVPLLAQGPKEGGTWAELK